MTTKWRWMVLGGGLYLAGLGFLGGIVAERVRFDAQRAAVLHRYDEAVRQWQAYLTKVEQEGSLDRAPSAAEEAEGSNEAAREEIGLALDRNPRANARGDCGGQARGDTGSGRP